MQLISLNAKAVIFLYLSITIISRIECLSHTDLDVSASENVETVVDAAKVPTAVDETSATSVDTKKVAVNSVVGTAKRLRNAVYGSRPNSYRSSYVGSKFDRRAVAAQEADSTEINSTEQESLIKATEQAPVIKAKRKLNNEFTDEVKYNVGPGVNIGVEKDKELVSVYLDEDCLKDVFTGNESPHRKGPFSLPHIHSIVCLI